jgi:tetratricopeptide (TPR) repeat protein
MIGVDALTQFRVTALVARGALSSVFRAVHVGTQQEVALKVIETDDERLLSRFARECALSAQLQHGAMPAYVAHGAEGHFAYLATRWIEGQTLTSKLQQGKLGVDEAMRLVARIASALSVMHALGIVHRDVKPSNIVLEGGDTARAMLVDLGIARDMATAGVTCEGDVVGTLGYMAPEQLRGTAVGPSADIFALGCVLYEAVAGQHPYEGGEALARAIRIMLEPARPITQVLKVNEAFAALVHQMLSREPAQRPDAASLLGECLPAAEAPPSASFAKEETLRCLLLAHGQWSNLSEITGNAVDAVGLPEEIVALCPKRQRGGLLDEAELAVRAALRALSQCPTARLMLVTGRSADEIAQLGEGVDVPLVDSAVRGLRASAEPGVFADAQAAALLGPEFEISKHASGLAQIHRELSFPPERKLLGRRVKMMGRDREIGRLASFVDEVMELGQPGAALVTAAPGVGKTRLAREFARGLRDKDQSLGIWFATADAFDADQPFALVKKLLRDAGFRPVDAVRLARLSGPETPDERARLVDSLEDLFGVAQDTQGPTPTYTQAPTRFEDRVRAFAACIRARSEHGLVVVADDLHWADEESVQCIIRVAEGERLPVFFAALGRPETTARFSKLAAASFTQQLRLCDLPRRASLDIIGTVMPLAIDEASRLAELAGGNPLLLEELLRARKVGRAATSSAVGLIEARMGELDVALRRCLRAASIWTEAFTPEQIAAFVGGDAESVLSMLTELAEREYVVPARQDVADTFVFRHALVRDVAYGTLTDDDRCAAHGMAAEWLRGHSPESHGALARHYELAGNTAKASSHRARAAEAAMFAGAVDAAYQHAELALQLGELAEGDATRVRWVTNETLLWRQDPKAVQECDASVHGNREGSPMWFRALAGLVFASTQHERFDVMFAAVNRMRNQVHTEGDAEDLRRAQVLAFALSCWSLSTIGVYPLALEFRDRLVRLSDEGPLEDVEQGWWHIAMFYVAQHVEADPWDGFQHANAARACFTRAKDERMQTLVAYKEAAALILLGEGEAAESLLAGMCSEPSKLVVGITHRFQASAANILGKYEEAVRYARSAIDTLGMPLYRGSARFALAEALTELGEHEEAEQAALTSVNEINCGSPMQARAFVELARARLAAGKAQGALEAARAGLALVARSPYGNVCDVRLHLMEAEALLTLGDAPLATRSVAVARRLLEARAARIPDAICRRSFLYGVTDHARTLTWSPTAGAFGSTRRARSSHCHAIGPSGFDDLSAETVAC